MLQFVICFSYSLVLFLLRFVPVLKTNAPRSLHGAVTQISRARFFRTPCRRKVVDSRILPTYNLD